MGDITDGSYLLDPVRRGQGSYPHCALVKRQYLDADRCQVLPDN